MPQPTWLWVSWNPLVWDSSSRHCWKGCIPDILTKRLQNWVIVTQYLDSNLANRIMYKPIDPLYGAHKPLRNDCQDIMQYLMIRPNNSDLLPFDWIKILDQAVHHLLEVETRI